MSDTVYYTGQGNPTTIDAVLKQAAVAAAAYTAQWNEALKSGYLAAFQAFAQGVSEGIKQAVDAPKPPMAWVVGSYTDPGSGVTFPAPVVGTTPVCDMPGLPPAPPPAIHPPVDNSVASVISAPPNDPWPVGYKFTKPDGSVWQKQAWGNPFAVQTGGVEYVYVRIS